MSCGALAAASVMIAKDVVNAVLCQPAPPGSNLGKLLNPGCGLVDVEELLKPDDKAVRDAQVDGLVVAKIYPRCPSKSLGICKAICKCSCMHTLMEHVPPKCRRYFTHMSLLPRQVSTLYG